MGFLNFLKNKEPEFVVNRFKYYPDDIASLQDSSKSVLIGTMYDMTCFSMHETKIIEMVLSAADRKYKGDFQAVGLVNECYPITYKPRYIVFEVVIQRYLLSEKPLEKIAVAFAYWSKGARYHGEAARLFEEAKEKVDWKKIHEFSSFGGFFYLFSKMYEKMHEYEKAIECVRLSSKYENPVKEYVKNRIAFLEEKQRNRKPYRPRKMSSDQEEFEKLVSLVAERYV